MDLLIDLIQFISFILSYSCMLMECIYICILFYIDKRQFILLANLIGFQYQMIPQINKSNANSNQIKHLTQIKIIKHYQLLIQLDQQTLIIKMMHQTQKSFIYYNNFFYDKLSASLKVLFANIEQLYKQLLMAGEQMFELNQKGLLKCIIPLRSKFFSFDMQMKRIEYSQLQQKKIENQILKSQIEKLNQQITQKNNRLQSQNQLIIILQQQIKSFNNNFQSNKQSSNQHSSKSMEKQNNNDDIKTYINKSNQKYDKNKDDQKSINRNLNQSKENSRMEIQNIPKFVTQKSYSKNIWGLDEDGQIKPQNTNDLKKTFQKQGKQFKNKPKNDIAKGKQKSKSKALWDYKPSNKNTNQPFRRKIQFQPSQMINFFIDQQHPNNSHFIFYDNRLKYTSPASNTLHMISSKTEENNLTAIYIFGFRIVKICVKPVIFGLTIRQNLGWLQLMQKNSVYIILKGNIVTLYIEANQKQTIQHVKVGDEIHIYVDFDKKSLHLYLNHQLQFISVLPHQLGVQDSMHGFVCMGGENDQIQLL